MLGPKIKKALGVQTSTKQLNPRVMWPTAALYILAYNHLKIKGQSLSIIQNIIQNLIICSLTHYQHYQYFHNFSGHFADKEMLSVT